MMTASIATTARIVSTSGAQLIAVHQDRCPAVRSDRLSDCICAPLFTLKTPRTRRAAR
jgi:hypothetical protein